MPNNKKIRIFAGPNGSGKSSLFKAFPKDLNTGPFINADELEYKLSQNGYIDLKEYGLKVTQQDLDTFKLLPASISMFDKAISNGHIIDVHVNNNCIVDASRSTHSYEGSFIAAFLRDQYVKYDRTFSFETVMSHPSKIEEIETIITKGYSAYLYFLCTDSPVVNISRVSNRVKKGGHPVDKKKIEDRYYRTLEALHQLLPHCYRAYLFDNSGKTLILIAELCGGYMKLKTNHPPIWFLKYVLPHYKN
jgi:predicted ABC-type ATPase